MSRAAIAAKVAGILAFVFLTNRFLDLGNRIDTLIHNFGGFRGVVIFGGLWIVCLAGILAAGFLPRLRLRILFAAPLLAGALVGSAYEDVAGTEIDYDQVLLLRESVAHLPAAVPLYVGSVFGGAHPAGRTGASAPARDGSPRRLQRP